METSADSNASSLLIPAIFLSLTGSGDCFPFACADNHRADGEGDSRQTHPMVVRGDSVPFDHSSMVSTVRPANHVLPNSSHACDRTAALGS